MKTAVEWLYKNLKSHFEHDGDLLEVVQFSFEQAKEMEKQQIIDAYKNGKYESDKIVMSDRFYAEQYYNEQFKNK
jgi:disulfide oxidoreductase YuzD